MIISNYHEADYAHLWSREGRKWKENQFEAIIFSESQFFQIRKLKLARFPSYTDGKANSAEVFDFIFSTLNFSNVQARKKQVNSHLYLKLQAFKRKNSDGKAAYVIITRKKNYILNRFVILRLNQFNS